MFFISLLNSNLYFKSYLLFAKNRENHGKNLMVFNINRIKYNCCKFGGLNMTKFGFDEAKKIGEELGIKWDKFDVNQFMQGMNVELEHGLINAKTNVTNDDFLMTGKIALAHLEEFPDYYDRLEKMEKEADKYWKK